MPVNAATPETTVASAETVDMPRVRLATTEAAPDAPAVAIVAGTGPHLSAETASLRRARLRAVALFFAVTTAALAVRDFAIGWPLAYYAVGMALLLAGLAFVLASSRPLTPRALCGIEFAIFGSLALGLATQMYTVMLTRTVNHDPIGLFGSIKNTLIATTVLAFAYSVLIPNPPRAALRVVILLWAVPFLSELVLFLVHPEVLDFAREVANLERVSENVLIGLVGAGLAIYGAYVVNGLRREAFEARRLNQYVLRDAIGGGGMGEVYLAEHRMLKRPCAIKLIRPESAGDAVALARFEREVQATARLSHPNTIEIYDYGQSTDGRFYYVMEYLRGLSLDILIARHGPLPAGRVIYLLRQACEALGEAHQAGLIHRDIKPANLFAAVRGGRCDVTKLLDFGLVKALDDGMAVSRSQTSDGHLRGTPQFMAPEQFTGDRKLDHRCDLYALGGVAYYLLTGLTPFRADTAVRVLLAHARDPVEPPSRHRAEVPADLEAVVLRCLAKSPDDRFPDATALARALDSCLAVSEWDADRAARWWASHEPQALLVRA